MSRRKIKAGTTSLTLPIYIQHSGTGAGLPSLVFNTASLAARYRRQGQSSWTSITLATATLGTWTSGGFITSGSVDGKYEVGIPNAVIAAGVEWAEVEYYGAANMDPVIIEFELDTIDYQALGGKIPATIAALDIATDAIDANSIKADAVTKIQVGLSTLNAAGVRTAVGLASANLDTQLDAIPTDTENATAVWTNATRTLTGFGFTVATTDVVLATSQPNYAPAKAGDAMALTPTERNLTAVEVESHLLDEGDSQMLINAIVGAIGNTNIDQAVLIAAIRADLERSGGNLNVLLSRLTSQRATNLDFLDVSVASIPTTITADHGAGSYVRNTEPDNTGIGTAITQASLAATNTTDLPSMIETNNTPSPHKRFKENALEEAPTGSGGGGGDPVGPGAISVPVTINSGDGNPIADCDVWVSSDSDGDTVVAGTLTTDVNGLVTFMLDAGNYWLWRQKSGWTFSNPSTMTVS